MRWRSAGCGDAERAIGEKDALGNGMVCLVVEITVDDGEDMVVLCARLVGVNNAIAEAALRKGPQLHAPKVKAGIPKLKPFTDMVRTLSVIAKIVIQQRINDARVALGLLQKCGNLACGSRVGNHQAPQIIGCICMQRQGSNDTKLGIAGQSELPPSKATVCVKQRANSASNVARALAVAEDCWD